MLFRHILCGVRSQGNIIATYSKIANRSFSSEIQRIPVNSNDFSLFSQNNYAFVDKTETIFKMIQNDRFYSISRPDSFGKTLLLSTIKQIFEGNHGLFKDTFIHSKPELFQKHPIINLDFGIGYKSITVRDFTQMIRNSLQKIAEQHGLNIDENLPIQETFGNFIVNLKNKAGPVVVLIDNFDKITLESIQYPKKRNDLIGVLTNILSALKDKEENIRFFMKTNTSLIRYNTYLYEKIQIKDISLDDDYSTILGFTEDEIKSKFGNYLKFYESQSTLSSKQIKYQIINTYGGYRFTSSNAYLYSPLGFLNYLSKGNPDNFVLQLNMPKYLRDYLQLNFVYGMPHKDFAGNFEILNQENFKEAHDKKWEKNHIFNRQDFYLTDLKKLEVHLFNLGFLSVKGYKEEENSYDINYVNGAVRRNIIKIYDEVYEKSKSYVEPFSG